MCASVLRHASFAPKSKNDALPRAPVNPFDPGISERLFRSARWHPWIVRTSSGLDLQLLWVAWIYSMFSQRNRELHKAIHNDNYAKVIQCLDVGPKRERKKVLDQVEGGGATPLTAAASRGHNRIVIALLDRGGALVLERRRLEGRLARLDPRARRHRAVRERQLRAAQLVVLKLLALAPLLNRRGHGVLVACGNSVLQAWCVRREAGQA